eukprot:TRINITY_DN5268_c0_g1_i8.p1 TRINITY_DN5268_c0_g1~~TRINITY_DN5268_c0_g1_i8.p1  ORF type:complete len:2379 (+),score=948.12 TRINITY_DN5268_c0_g1_i8:215-7351(+)
MFFFSDDCISEPCGKGVCIDQVNAYTCQCNDGWERDLTVEGDNCASNIDDCSPDQCIHGTCVDGENNFSCICDAGFVQEGLCETEIDECLNHNCANGADCVDLINGYKCLCPTGWDGDLCNEPKGAPTLLSMDDVTIVSGETGEVIAFVSDVNTALNDLIVTAVATNVDLLPATSVSVTGSEGRRVITFQPIAGKVGNSLVTVSVFDGIHTDSKSVFVTVEAAIEKPTTGEVMCASYGDPNLMLFTGATFAYGGVGETTLFKSIDGTLKVHACMQPVGRMTRNSLVAIDLNGTSFTISNDCSTSAFTSDVITVTPTDLNMTVEDKSTTVKQLSIEFKDLGLKMGATCHNDLIDVFITASRPDWYQKTSGLCGAYDMSLGSPYVSSDGNTAGSANVFANSWMVSDSDKMFDDASCPVAPNSYVPNYYPSFGDNTALELRATQLCQSLDGALNDSCLNDVALKSDEDFIWSSFIMRRYLDILLGKNVDAGKETDPGSEDPKCGDVDKNGLVLKYSFDSLDIASGSVTDESETGLCVGTLYGVKSATDGIVKSALFSGSEKLNIEDSVNMNLNTEMSVMLWFQRMSGWDNSVPLISNGFTDSATFGIWLSAVEDNKSTLTGGFGTQASPSITELSTDLVMNKEDPSWYHVAFTYSGSVTKLYLNGEFVSESFADLGALLVSDSPIELAYSRGTGLSGQIDNLEIHGVALTNNEIASAFNEGVTAGIVGCPEGFTGDSCEIPVGVPSISALDDITMYTGETKLVDLWISDENTPLNELTLSVKVSNSDLFSDESAVIADDNGAKKLLIKPIAGKTGNCLVTITVFDGIHKGTASTYVTVESLAEAPTSGTVMCTVFGDPTMQMFSGQTYTYHSQGEFVLMDTSSMSVHGCQSEEATVKGATGMTAVVIKEGEVTATIQNCENTFNSPAAAKVAGVETETVVEDLLYEGYSVSRKTISVTFPSGAVLRTSCMDGLAHMNVYLTVKRAEFYKATDGLCGAYDFDLASPYRLSDDTLLAENPSINDVRKKFASSWLVTDDAEKLMTESVCPKNLMFIPEYFPTFENSTLETSAEDICTSLQLGSSLHEACMNNIAMKNDINAFWYLADVVKRNTDELLDNGKEDSGTTEPSVCAANPDENVIFNFEFTDFTDGDATVADIGGASCDATLTGSVSKGTGIDADLQLKDSTGLMEVTSMADFNGWTTAMTLNLWFKRDSADVEETLIEYGDTLKITLGIASGDDSKYTVAAFMGTSDHPIGDTPVVSGELSHDATKWALLTLTYDLNERTTTLFIDAVAVESSINASGQLLKSITGFFVSSSSAPFNGEVDNVKLYSKLLGTADIVTEVDDGKDKGLSLREPEGSSSSGGSSGSSGGEEPFVCPGGSNNELLKFSFTGFTDSDSEILDDADGECNAIVENLEATTAIGVALTFSEYIAPTHSVSRRLIDGVPTLTIDSMKNYPFKLSASIALWFKRSATNNDVKQILITNKKTLEITLGDVADKKYILTAGVASVTDSTLDNLSVELPFDTLPEEEPVWVHVAVTYDSEGSTILYINGEEVDSSTNDVGRLITSDQPLVISDPSAPFVGDLDEFVMMSSTLTDNEVQDLYNVGVSAELKMKADPVAPVSKPPIVSAIASQTVQNAGQIGTVHFVVSDEDTALEDLTITAKSSDSSMISDWNIVLSGSGKDRTLTFKTSASNTEGGDVNITVFVADEESTVSSSFAVTISAAEPDSSTEASATYGECIYHGFGHMVTFTDYQYDVYGIGEYTMVKSDDLEISICGTGSSGFKTNAATCVSMRTASGVLIQMEASGSIKINYVPMTEAHGAQLGVAYSISDESMQVTLADGAVVKTNMFDDKSFFNIHVRLPTITYFDKTDGLCGKYAIDEASPLFTSTGSRLPYYASSGLIFMAFAPTWAVSSNSLMTGISCNTRDNYEPQFLNGLSGALDIEAREICKDFPIIYFKSCLYDIGIRGDVEFVKPTELLIDELRSALLELGNNAPKINGLSDMEVEAGEDVQVVFTLEDPDTPSDELDISVTSSNDALLPDQFIHIYGDESERTLLLKPTGQNSTTIITVLVSDGSSVTSDEFELKVLPLIEVKSGSMYCQYSGNSHIAQFAGNQVTIPAAGEFAMVKSSYATALSVSICQTRSDTYDTLTMATAVGMIQNGIRVTIYDGGNSIIVDGQQFVASKAYEGVTIHQGDTIKVAFGTGEIIEVIPALDNNLLLMPIVKLDRKTYFDTLSGVCGTYDLEPERAFMAKDGTYVSLDSSQSDLFTQFSETYRLDGSTTLLQGVNCPGEGAFMPFSETEPEAVVEKLAKVTCKETSGTYEENCIADVLRTPDLGSELAVAHEKAQGIYSTDLELDLLGQPSIIQVSLVFVFSFFLS